MERTPKKNAKRAADVTFLTMQQTPLSAAEREIILAGITAAKDAVAHPSQSGFHVKTAAVTEGGHIITGGNAENSISDAFVHGETSVVTQALSQFPQERIQTIAFYDPSPTVEPSNASPCGACRDVLVTYLSPDAKIAQGNERRIGVARLADFLKDTFREIPTRTVNRRGVRQAALAVKQSVTAYAPEEIKPNVYGVSLVGRTIRRGSFYTNAGYDAVPAGLSAVQTWRNTTNPNGVPEDLERIVIAGYNRVPRPLYRDRQALLELDEVLRETNGRANPVQVDLVALDPQTNRVIKAEQTDTQEWLPFPFSPGSFGMTDALQSQWDSLYTRGK